MPEIFVICMDGVCSSMNVPPARARPQIDREMVANSTVMRMNGPLREMDDGGFAESARGRRSRTTAKPWTRRRYLNRARGSFARRSRGVRAAFAGARARRRGSARLSARFAPTRHGGERNVRLERARSDPALRSRARPIAAAEVDPRVRRRPRAR
ncbi:MAG TPA: hypothetical protein VGC30_04715 [Dokdonella sp.]